MSEPANDNEDLVEDTYIVLIRQRHLERHDDDVVYLCRDPTYSEKEDATEAVASYRGMGFDAMAVMVVYPEPS